MKHLKFFLLFCNCILWSCDNSVDVKSEKLIANAGPDQTSMVGSYIILDPSKSSGSINWYEWIQDANNPEKVPLFSSSTSEKVTVGFDKEGIYRFRLIVRNGVTPSNFQGTGYSDPVEIKITVNKNLNSKFEDPNLEIAVRVKLNQPLIALDENSLLNLVSLENTSTPKKISSLKGLEYCKNLTSLLMSSQNISDISPLTTLTKLKKLGLDQNRIISDISPLAGLTELEWLNLDSNLLTDISALNNLIKLKYLNLQLNTIYDINVLRNMKELETLLLFKASLTDISSLSDLVNLKQLWIITSEVTDISSLSKLKNTMNLHLAWNHIVDASALANMRELEWVALEKNNIADIFFLKDLPNLSYVRLWDNQITDIKPLVDNPNLGKGDIIALDGNPLNEKSINVYIPQLLSRGINVTW